MCESRAAVIGRAAAFKHTYYLADCKLVTSKVKTTSSVPSMLMPNVLNDAGFHRN